MDSRIRDWVRTGASSLSQPRRIRSFARDVGFRLERRYAHRFSDVQLRQLRRLERAYSRRHPPQLLVFGDSTMFWTAPTDTDHRHVVEMIGDDLGPGVRVEAIVGGLYNARMVLAFLAALDRVRYRPEVVIVPVSVMMSQTIWLASPDLGYGHTSEEMRRIVAAGRRRRPRRLVDTPSPESILVWERLTAPSLFGANRTVGELRLITGAAPATRWQSAVRLRHLMDSYNAETLGPRSPGVRLVREMGEALQAMQLPAVGYVPPVNHEVAVSTLGEGAYAHIEHNAAIIADAFLEGTGDYGDVVNTALDFGADEFRDPLHLSSVGRARFAEEIATAVKRRIVIAGAGGGIKPAAR